MGPRAALILLLSFLSADAAAIGALDPAFASRGVLLSTSPLGGSAAVGYGIAADPQGGILVAGVLSDSSGTFRMSLWRFTEQGQPDSAFGKNGVWSSPQAEWARAMRIDSRGRVVLAGFAGNDWSKSERAVIRRLLPDGSPDRSFGKDGVVASASPLRGDHAAVYAVSIGPKDGITATGAASGPRGEVRGALWRYLEDGRPDEVFGARGFMALPDPPGGRDTTSWGLEEERGSVWATGTSDWRKLTLWSVSPSGGIIGSTSAALGVGRGFASSLDGRMYVAGFRYAYKGDKVVGESALLRRYLSDGRADQTFGAGGEVSLGGPGRLPDRESFAVVRADEGTLYLAGYASKKDLVSACVWAVSPSGAPIARFGQAGVLIPPAAAGGTEDRVYAISLDGKGRLLATGFSRGPDKTMHLAVWRIVPK